MKLTKDDFQIFESCRISITRSLDDFEKIRDEILKWQEDAEKWNKFISNFPNIDFRRLEFLAIKEVGKETETHKFG